MNNLEDYFVISAEADARRKVIDEYITNIETVITDASGEIGIGEKIADNIRDYYTLDLIHEIQYSTNITYIVNMIHPITNPRLCLAGLSRLWQLWVTCRDNENQLQQKIGFINKKSYISDFVSTSALDVVIRCMKYHPLDVNIQINGCKLLIFFFSNSVMPPNELIIHAGSSEFINIVVNTIQNHINNVEAVACATLALVNMQWVSVQGFYRTNNTNTVNNNNNNNAAYHMFYPNLAHAGAVPLLFQALDIHPNSPSVVINSLRLLGSFPGDEPVGSNALTEYMSEHPEWCNTVDNVVDMLSRDTTEDFIRRGESFLLIGTTSTVS